MKLHLSCIVVYEGTTLSIIDRRNIVCNNGNNVIPQFSDKLQYQLLGFCILWSNFVHKRIKNGGIVKKIIKIFIFFLNISDLLVGRGGKKEKPLLFKFKLVKLDYCKFVASTKLIFCPPRILFSIIIHYSFKRN